MCVAAWEGGSDRAAAACASVHALRGPCCPTALRARVPARNGGGTTLRSTYCWLPSSPPANGGKTAEGRTLAGLKHYIFLGDCWYASSPFAGCRLLRAAQDHLPAEPPAERAQGWPRHLASPRAQLPPRCAAPPPTSPAPCSLPGSAVRARSRICGAGCMHLHGLMEQQGAAPPASQGRPRGGPPLPCRPRRASAQLKNASKGTGLCLRAQALPQRVR